LGIYREDGIYCQGITGKVAGRSSFICRFPKLLLLHGKYRFSAGIWDEGARDFLVCHHGIYPLRMGFNRPDHGTIYLEHQWQWRLPE